MSASEEQRYSMAEASQHIGVAPHVLRQWEARFPNLRPKRNRSGQRIYTERDLAVARRIKELLREEKLTGDGASKALARELRGEAPPKTRHDALEMLDRIDAELRSMLDTLDGFESSEK